MEETLHTMFVLIATSPPPVGNTCFPLGNCAGMKAIAVPSLADCPRPSERRTQALTNQNTPISGLSGRDRRPERDRSPVVWALSADVLSPREKGVLFLLVLLSGDYAHLELSVPISRGNMEEIHLELERISSTLGGEQR